MTVTAYIIVAAASAVAGALLKTWFTKKVAAPVSADVASVKSAVAAIKKAV